MAPMATGTLEVQRLARSAVGSRTREAQSSLSALRIPSSMIISATVVVATIIWAKNAISAQKIKRMASADFPPCIPRIFTWTECRKLVFPKA